MAQEPSERPNQDNFCAAFGEPIERVLDVNTWRMGADIAEFYDRMREEVAESIAQARRTREPIRNLVFPRLRERTDAKRPKAAGLYRIIPEEIALVHRGLLFNGGVEACDGTDVAHDSLLLSAIQIGFALVAYQGNAGTWVQRLYRRDLRVRFDDPMEEALALLERRSRPVDRGEEEPDASPSRIVRRALREYAERAALTELSTAGWRIGHGNPIASSLLVASTPDIVRAGVETMRKLILGHRRFLFVVSETTNHGLLSIGNALYPNEFVVVGTMIDSPYFTDKRLTELARTQSGHPVESKLIQDFLKEVRTEIVVGAYRAGPHAPPRVFYAHKDFACEAAAIAIADSVLQPHRSFPMLIDLADLVCRTTFDGASFHGSLYDAYAAAGEPTRYLGERETRS